MKLNLKEMEILKEDMLRTNQLQNLRRVMNSSITPKKLKRIETEDLPGYLVRQRNARSAAEKVMKKYGLHHVDYLR